jgi:hypothetical protein
LTLAEDGQITGTPSAEGTTTFTVRVKGAAGGTAGKALSITVEADTKPTIAESQLPPAQQGAAYRHVLNAEGGNGALTWRPARRHTAPAGLHLEPDGTVWGSPVKTGTFRFTVEAMDADLPEPDTASTEVSIDIAPAGPEVLFVRPLGDATITVDGVLDEDIWALDEEIARLVGGEATGVAAAFDVVADGSQIFLAFRINDPQVKENRDELWNGDSVEVFLDTKNDRETTYNFDDRRFVIGAERGRMHVVGNARGAGAKVHKTEDGYTVEMAIRGKWNYHDNTYDRAIGLDVAVNDSADGATRDCRLVWRGTKDNETDPSGFATAILPGSPEKPKRK